MLPRETSEWSRKSEECLVGTYSVFIPKVFEICLQNTELPLDVFEILYDMDNFLIVHVSIVNKLDKLLL